MEFLNMETIRKAFVPGAEYLGRDVITILEKHADLVSLDKEDSIETFCEKRGRITYICSPYRAKNDKELRRNIAYARELTRMVLMRGDVPITPHLYLPQCADDADPKERKAGLYAGMSILRCCDHMVVGTRYGISQGMKDEIQCVADGRADIEWLS